LGRPDNLFEKQTVDDSVVRYKERPHNYDVMLLFLLDHYIFVNNRDFVLDQINLLDIYTKKNVIDKIKLVKNGLESVLCDMDQETSAYIRLLDELILNYDELCIVDQ
jgi:hypothetical protein